MRTKQNLQHILDEHEKLEMACEKLAEGHIESVPNQTLTVSDIEMKGQSVSFTVVQSWQGNADSMSFSFPTMVVSKAMDDLVC